MDFRFSSEHEAFRQMVREFAAREIAPYIREWDERGHFEFSVLEKMGELGILGVCIPERWGGGGMDYISLAIAAEEIEYVESSYREYISVHTGLTSLALLQWGTEEQKERYLKPLARGEKFAAFGLTEPNAGSDVAGLQTVARRHGDVYVLNGEKAWITLGDRADVVLIFAKTDPEARHEGISAFIVEKTFPGFKGTPIKNKLGVRAGSTARITLQDVEVPVENRLGEEGEGFKIAMSALDNGRMTVAAGAVGLIRACIDASVRYAQQREAFGRPIGRFQLVQRMIAEMVAGYEASRWLAYHAAWLKNQGIRNTRETSLAKWFATEAAWKAADMALQIHGAYGYSSEYPVERFLRNSRAAVIYEGTTQIHQLMQAEYALGYRRDAPLRRELPAWPFGEDA
ncbi:MAG: acyl-CoA dehydrogenase family protein [Bacillota bacterium]|nr:butyryl-CoA dehydrogenase [Bacillota bacterium]REJ34037.1 MAG: butyryl-CoA dehydrogenase [Bacillota bacterium]